MSDLIIKYPKKSIHVYIEDNKDDVAVLIKDASGNVYPNTAEAYVDSVLKKIFKGLK